MEMKRWWPLQIFWIRNSKMVKNMKTDEAYKYLAIRRDVGWDFYFCLKKINEKLDINMMFRKWATNNEKNWDESNEKMKNKIK